MTAPSGQKDSEGSNNHHDVGVDSKGPAAPPWPGCPGNPVRREETPRAGMGWGGGQAVEVWIRANPQSPQDGEPAPSLPTPSSFRRVVMAWSLSPSQEGDLQEERGSPAHSLTSGTGTGSFTVSIRSICVE